MPGLASRLPRPGAWMEDVRTLLAFALLATVVWLLWVASRSTGAEGVVWLLELLLAIGMLSWLFGRVQGRVAGHPGRLLALFAAALAILVIVGVRALPVEARSVTAMNPADGIAEWHSAHVRDSVESGQVVFVEFTADWCLSCKVNERVVLSRPEIDEAMRRFNVVRYRADWTLRDEAIFAELQLHGRAGVPLYLVYRGGAPDEPEILPEVLTIDTVVAALHRASGVESGIGMTEVNRILARPDATRI